MARQLPVYEFTETGFVGGSDPLSTMRFYMTLTEVDEAFSGDASYRQAPWMKRYVGVWRRKNCQRVRRFLRERGAKVVLHRGRPERLRLARYKTQWEAQQDAIA